MRAHGFKKILVVALDNLGDAVLGSSLVRVILENNPRGEVGFWIKKYAADAFPERPALKIHAADPFWDKAPGQKKGNWKEFWRVVREIRREKYEVAFVLNSEWRRAGIVRLIKIPFRIGLDQRKSRLFLTHAYPSNPQNHVAEDHLSLFRNFFKSEPGRPLPLHLRGDYLRPPKNRTQRNLIVHPLSGDDRKNWPMKFWIELVTNVLAKFSDWNITVVGGAGDRNLLEEKFGTIDRGRLIIVANKLPQFREALVGGHGFVGNDSGPGHMAAAMGLPVVSLFGPSDPARYRPLGPGSITILHQDPLGSIPVARVQWAVEEKLIKNISASAY